jgi:hypothetical protein
LLDHRFDALRNDFDAEAAAEIDDGLDDRSVAVAVREVVNEGAVDLDIIDPELLEV